MSVFFKIDLRSGYHQLKIIPEGIPKTAYQLELPTFLSVVHDVFHVSQLKKCPLVLTEQTPLEGIDLQEEANTRCSGEFNPKLT